MRATFSFTAPCGAAVSSIAAERGFIAVATADAISLHDGSTGSVAARFSLADVRAMTFAPATTWSDGEGGDASSLSSCDLIAAHFSLSGTRIRWDLTLGVGRAVAEYAGLRTEFPPVILGQGRGLVASGGSSDVALYHASGGPAALTFDPHSSNSMRGIAASRGGLLITAGADFTVRLWNVGASAMLPPGAAAPTELRQIRVDSAIRRIAQSWHDHHLFVAQWVGNYNVTEWCALDDERWDGLHSSPLASATPMESECTGLLPVGDRSVCVWYERAAPRLLRLDAPDAAVQLVSGDTPLVHVTAGATSLGNTVVLVSGSLVMAWHVTWDRRSAAVVAWAFAAFESFA